MLLNAVVIFVLLLVIFGSLIFAGLQAHEIWLSRTSEDSGPIPNDR